MIRIFLLVISLFVTACSPPTCDQVVTKVCDNNSQCTIVTQKENDECRNDEYKITINKG